MSEKQLYDVINKVEPKGQVVTYKGIPCTARTCVTRLYRLTKENEQLTDLLSNEIKKNAILLEENKELQDTINIICKDFEESHGMDIRNADWFTAW